jgi:hypothetical protein
MKLPAFYVLDAVAKNVYDPYARAFSAFIIPLFLESYGQVDQSTRSKMEEMLLTWRTGGPTSKELFGVGAQVAMERGIWGGQEQPQVRRRCSRTRCHHKSMLTLIRLPLATAPLGKVKARYRRLKFSASSNSHSTRSSAYSRQILTIVKHANITVFCLRCAPPSYCSETFTK